MFELIRPLKLCDPLLCLHDAPEISKGRILYNALIVRQTLRTKPPIQGLASSLYPTCIAPPQTTSMSEFQVTRGMQELLRSYFDKIQQARFACKSATKKHLTIISLSQSQSEQHSNAMWARTGYPLRSPPSRPPLDFSSTHDKLYSACQELHKEIKANLSSISGRSNRIRTLWSSMDRQSESTEAGQFQHQELSRFQQHAEQLVAELKQDEIWSSSSVPGYPEGKDSVNVVGGKLKRWQTYLTDLSFKVSQTERNLMRLGIGMENLLDLRRSAVETEGN